MTQYAVFLRGINVGGNRQISMAALKASFEAMGFGEVRTILQTGNVVISSEEHDLAALKTTIEAALTAEFHYPAIVIVRLFSDLDLIIKAMPFGPAEGIHNYVVFLAKPELQAELLQPPVNPDIEQLASGDGVIYWSVERGMTLKSDFAKQLAKSKFRDHHTVRNIKTLLKL